MGRKPLILFKEHEHGKIIKKMLPKNLQYRYITGKDTAEDRKALREDFDAGKVKLIAASSIYDQGVNLRALDALILFHPGKSSGKMLQRIGRCIRGFNEGNKKNAIIVDCWDQAPYLKKHSYLRYSICRTESEFKFKLPVSFETYIKKMDSNGGKEKFNP
jgi:superfamily II DNA or RNA helicase